MSGAIDKMTAEDTALMRDMQQAEHNEPEPTQEREPSRERELAPEAQSEPETQEERAERQRTVPHEQFHAEREKRKAMQAELQKYREETAAERARLEERFRLLSEAVRQPQQPVQQPQAPVIPDFATDPAGNIDGRFRTLETQAQEARAQAQRANEALQQQHQMAEMRNWAASQEQQFEAATPDYRQAMGHLVESRNRQLEALGVPAHQRQQVLANDIAQIAQQTRQQGRNFAETLYTLAKASGYTAKQAQSAVEAAISAPPSDAERQATTIERGRQMSTTVGTAGTAPATRLSPERIASMSEREFNAVYAKIAKDPAAMREMFGG